MMHLLSLVTFLFSAAAAGSPRRHPFEKGLSKRQTQSMDALQVDLGYSIFQGFSDTAVGINTWKG